MSYYNRTHPNIGEFEREQADPVDDANRLVRSSRAAGTVQWALDGMTAALVTEAMDMVERARDGDAHAFWLLGELNKARRVLKRAIVFKGERVGGVNQPTPPSLPSLLHAAE